MTKKINSEIAKGKLLFEQIKARLTGDTAEALAAQIARKSISAWESQIASAKAELVDAEFTLEEAEEALHNAICPTTMFKNNKEYCQSIGEAKSKVDDTKAYIEDLEKTISYFEALLSKYCS